MFRLFLTAVLLLACVFCFSPKADAGTFAVRTGIGNQVILVDDGVPNLNFLSLGNVFPSSTVVLSGNVRPPVVAVRGRNGAVILNNNANVLEVQQRGLFGRRTVIRVR